MTDHPRILDVDLSVLTRTEPCPGDVYCLPGHEPDELCTHCDGSGRVPSTSWMPWKPTPCVCDRGVLYRDNGIDPPEHRHCPACNGSGVVVPLLGDRILHQVEEWREVTTWVTTEWNDRKTALLPGGYHEYRLRTVAVSTVHQDPVPIVLMSGPELGDEQFPLITVNILHPTAAPMLWRGPEQDDMFMLGDDEPALLDGPWGEQWVPGNVALAVTTEVLG